MVVADAVGKYDDRADPHAARRLRQGVQMFDTSVTVTLNSGFAALRRSLLKQVVDTIFVASVARSQGNLLDQHR